jgi:hypothetical protein
MNQEKRKYSTLIALAFFIAPFFIQLVHAEVHHHAPTTETGFIEHRSQCLINSYEFQPHFLFEYIPLLPVNRICLGEINSNYAPIYIPVISQGIRLRAPPAVSLLYV